MIAAFRLGDTVSRLHYAAGHFLITIELEGCPLVHQIDLQDATSRTPEIIALARDVLERIVRLPAWPTVDAFDESIAAPAMASYFRDHPACHA